MPTGEIRMQVGVADFVAVARRLRETGNRDVRLELMRAITKAASPVRSAVRRSALDTLPHAGGLAALVAGSRITISRRTSGASAGIRVVGSSEHDIRAMDLGIVRHPRYGDRRVWYQQEVQPGWWTTPTEEAGAAARPEVIAVIDRIKRKIEG